MPWYSYLFFFLAFCAFWGISIHANARNTHRMVYSILMFAVWAALGLWTGGHLG